MTTLRKPVSRVTNTPLGTSFGCDRNRRVVVKIIPGNGHSIPDLIELRPQGTRRAELVAIVDVYAFAMRRRVNTQLLAKARERKAKKAQQREQRSIERAERRLVR